MTDQFRDLAKLQEQRFLASEEARNKLIDKILYGLYRDAYNETAQQIASLYAKVGIENPKDGVFIRKEDAIRYNQLNNRLANLETEMRTLEKKGVKFNQDVSANSIQDAYYSDLWSYDQAVGIPLKIPSLPISAIRAAVYSDVSGLTFVKTWRKNITDQIYKTQAAIMRGITQGYSYTKIARSIKDQFNKGLSDSERVVRTEAGRCWSEGAEAAHQAGLDAGLEIRKRWSATLDFRTRPSHGRLDGTFADEQGLFHLSGASAPQPREFGVPGEDINCRCSTYDVLDGITPTMRRIRGEGIVPYQTFADWAAPKGWTEAKGWPKVRL